MVKIFYTSDIHGSDACFRKFLDVGTTLDVDAMIVGGDISGKRVVPITERNGRFETCYQGEQHDLCPFTELEQFERALHDRGHYPIRVDSDENGAFGATPSEVSTLFMKATRESICRWLELAESRLRKTGIECYIMLGNDDPSELADLLDQCDVVINPDQKRVVIRDEIEMISLGYSNLTPFDSHRELPEPDIERMLAKMADELIDAGSSIFNVHVPPHSSGLDNAPELDENLEAILFHGKPRFVPVGSTAVRKTLLERQPMLGLHGHLHESPGSVQLGRTLCINPGSSFAQGVLHGAIIHIEDGQVCSHQLVTYDEAAVQRVP